MIDVFMLVKEGILFRDPENNAISSVKFCECELEHFAEIKELIAREDAGFFGRLEEVVLFSDDNFSGQFPNKDSISEALEDEGLSDEQRDKLQLKRTFFDVQASFPYDYINLDFCDYYYPIPDMLKINRTLERVFEWQSRTDDQTLIDDFVIAVTCRHDNSFPKQAHERLANLIQANCNSSSAYKNQILATRKVQNVADWIKADKEDLFFAGWPKDIASTAKQAGWSMTILEYLYYRRNDSDGTPYIITCLVARFTRPRPLPSYLPAAFYALDKTKRTLIEDVDRTTPEGIVVIDHLKEIVEIRNEQARRVHREELPAP